MKWFETYRMRLVLVGFVAAIMLEGGNASADFVFGEPTNMGPTVNTTSFSEVAPSVSADNLSLYFNSNRPGTFGRGDIWVTTRQTVNDLWGEPLNLGPLVNTEHGENHPEISADGLELYFVSDQPGGYGVKDIWVARRQSRDDDWRKPVNLGSLVNSQAYEISPSISTDGLELYFSDYTTELARPSGRGGGDLWVTRRPTRTDPWQEPMNLGPVVNSSSQDARPHISPDGLVLFFDSQRDGGYGQPPYGELYMTRRRTLSDPWGIPVNLGLTVNTPDFEECPSVSPDGKTLFFDRSIVYTSGSPDIWQAPIIPIIDFNGDGIVDSVDMCIMVDQWGTDDPLCDIGPMPWGDGIVDVEDLKVLAEHLFEDVNDPTLVAHWPLDEAQGVIAYDSASDCDGTLIGGPVWQPDSGMVAGSLQFDGIDDYVSTDPVLNPADGTLSVVAWVMGGAPGQVILSQADGANWLRTDSVEGNLMTELKAYGRGAAGPLLSQAAITDGNWHRIGLVWDGSYRHLYVDGAEVAKDAAPLSALEGAEGGLYFGVGGTLAPGTYFSGLIDDIRIYNRVVKP